MDSLTNNRAPQATTPPEQTGTSAMENHPTAIFSAVADPTATFSAIPDPGMEEQVPLQVAQKMRSSHPSFLGITDDEMDGKEEEQLQTTRRSNITSGKLGSTDTTAI